MSENQLEDWCVNCSDEESYQSTSAPAQCDTVDVQMTSKPSWEPSGQQIAFLYRTLEKMGSIDLKWQCPGRRSPSVHSNSLGNDKKVAEGSEQSKLALEPNEFDFDDDMFDEPSASKISVPRRKSVTQGTKKVAKLDNIMKDIKKYQIVDQPKKQSSD